MDSSRSKDRSDAVLQKRVCCEAIVDDQKRAANIHAEVKKEMKNTNLLCSKSRNRPCLHYLHCDTLENHNFMLN